VQERQRTVIVVATGLALAVLAVTINRHLSDTDAGWFAYAPNTGVTFDPSSRTAIWREAAIWLGAIAAWSASRCGSIGARPAHNFRLARLRPLGTPAL
jgi:hypothetical protein